jgi:hypothetical protein
MQRIVALADTTEALFAIHEDAEEARRLVTRSTARADAPLSTLLSGNDSLAAIAVDSGGRLWVSSGSGHVYTEAPLVPAEPAAEALEVHRSGERSAWSITALPGSRAADYGEGGCALWIAPGAVWIGTTDGKVHRLSAGGWSLLDVQGTEPIGAIAGSGDTDVWFSSGLHELWHFDGRELTRIPPLANEIEYRVTGIVSTGVEEAIVCTAQGHLLACSRRGGTRALFIAQPSISIDGNNRVTFDLSHSWAGIGRIDDRLYAASTRGLFQWTQGRLEPIDAPAMTPKGLQASPRGVFVIDKGRRKEARVIHHSPDGAGARVLRFAMG